MSTDEQRLRMRELRNVVFGQPVQAWAAEFLHDLQAVEPASPASASAASDLESAVQDLQAAKHRTLLLDYDGTLAPTTELPSLAAPTPQLLNLLRRLADASATTVHIVTGRSQESIEPWLGSLPLWLHVEHGLRSRKPDGTWLPSMRERPPAFETASRIMAKYAQRTRGALVESKAVSVAFHYRRADPFVAFGTLVELRHELQQTLGPDVELLDGHKVLELRLRGVAKNVAVKIALDDAPADSVILAAGDDRTDEDMFGALPPEAFSIRVGSGATAAKLRVESPRTLLGLLARLV
jgi:trehalose 6-phosphate synthase/phosphatase